MKVSRIITNNPSDQRLEHSYLLCLALLNFEHQVNVVFVDHAFKSILADEITKKQWMALKLYGVEAFYQLNLNIKHCDPRSGKHCLNLDKTSFDALKNEMDMLL